MAIENPPFPVEANEIRDPDSCSGVLQQHHQLREALLVGAHSRKAGFMDDEWFAQLRLGALARESKNGA
ncbi:MAG: hypothetical protein V4787_18875 [Pseudomonadota bacterium]